MKSCNLQMIFGGVLHGNAYFTLSDTSVSLRFLCVLWQLSLQWSKAQQLHHLVLVGLLGFVHFCVVLPDCPCRVWSLSLEMDQERANNPPGTLKEWCFCSEIQTPLWAQCPAVLLPVIRNKVNFEARKDIATYLRCCCDLSSTQKITLWLCFSIQLLGNGVNGCQPVPGHSDGAGP